MRRRAEITWRVMQSRERQTYLLQLSDALRELEDPHEITKTALLMIKEHLGAEHSLKTIYTDETSYMMAEGGSDNTGLYLQGAYQASEYPACHEILCSGEMLVINDSLTTQRIPLDEARRLLSCNLRACVARLSFIRAGWSLPFLSRYLPAFLDVGCKLIWDR